MRILISRLRIEEFEINQPFGEDVLETNLFQDLRRKGEYRLLQETDTLIIPASKLLRRHEISDALGRSEKL
jgi:hypothetical protein